MTHTYSKQRQHFAATLASVAPIAFNSVIALTTANSIAMQINPKEPLSDQQAEGMLTEIGATIDLAGRISCKLTNALTNLEQSEDDTTDVTDITTIIKNLAAEQVIDPLSQLNDNMMESDLVGTLKLAVTQVNARREELRELRASIEQFSEQGDMSVAMLVGKVHTTQLSWAITMRHLVDLHVMMMEFDQLSAGNDSIFETPTALVLDEPSVAQQRAA